MNSNLERLSGGNRQIGGGVAQASPLPANHSGHDAKNNAIQAEDADHRAKKMGRSCVDGAEDTKDEMAEIIAGPMFIAAEGKNRESHRQSLPASFIMTAASALPGPHLDHSTSSSLDHAAMVQSNHLGIVFLQKGDHSAAIGHFQHAFRMLHVLCSAQQRTRGDASNDPLPPLAARRGNAAYPSPANQTADNSTCMHETHTRHTHDRLQNEVLMTIGSRGGEAGDDDLAPRLPFSNLLGNASSSPATRSSSSSRERRKRRKKTRCSSDHSRERMNGDDQHDFHDQHSSIITRAAAENENGAVATECRSISTALAETTVETETTPKCSRCERVNDAVNQNSGRDPRRTARQHIETLPLLPGCARSDTGSDVHQDQDYHQHHFRSHHHQSETTIDSTTQLQERCSIRWIRSSSSATTQHPLNGSKGSRHGGSEFAINEDGTRGSASHSNDDKGVARLLRPRKESSRPGQEDHGSGRRGRFPPEEEPKRPSQHMRNEHTGMKNGNSCRRREGELTAFMMEEADNNTLKESSILISENDPGSVVYGAALSLRPVLEALIWLNIDYSTTSGRSVACCNESMGGNGIVLGSHDSDRYGCGAMLNVSTGLAVQTRGDGKEISTSTPHSSPSSAARSSSSSYLRDDRTVPRSSCRTSSSTDPADDDTDEFTTIVFSMASAIIIFNIALCYHMKSISSESYMTLPLCRRKRKDPRSCQISASSSSSSTRQKIVASEECMDRAHTLYGKAASIARCVDLARFKQVNSSVMITRRLVDDDETSACCPHDHHEPPQTAAMPAAATAAALKHFVVCRLVLWNNFAHCSSKLFDGNAWICIKEFVSICKKFPGIYHSLTSSTTTTMTPRNEDLHSSQGDGAGNASITRRMTAETDDEQSQKQQPDHVVKLFYKLCVNHALWMKHRSNYPSPAA
mmetsp:Transcript_15828/g.44366  ORF Transcript_15828/g.44366 Transcript_15828/m.44366 type:complete len:919 (-) Transcript_15828:2161-4917(-)